MNEDLLFIKQYQSKGALFDANLLLVYVVGKCGTNRLRQLDHTKQYADDFDTIEQLVESFAALYTTPNVLTEVSNLGKKVGVEFFDQLKRIVYVLDERHCPSKDAASNKYFRKLGLTDSALLNLGPKFLIITGDFALYSILRANKIDAAISITSDRPCGPEVIVGGGALSLR